MNRTGMAVLLPGNGRGLDSARHVAHRAVAGGTGLLVAVAMPAAHTWNTWGPALPNRVDRHEFVLDTMIHLTVTLSPTGVPWTLFPVAAPRTELPGALREAGVTELYVHLNSTRWPFAARATRTAAALARCTGTDVHVIHRSPSPVPGTHSQDHTVIPVNGGRRAGARRIG